jgi:hypothetical protein
MAEEPKKVELSGYDYASSAPKIMLEVVSARSATLIILVTYSVFIIGFLIDIFTTFQSFRGSDKYLIGQVCTSDISPIYYSDKTIGCYEDNSWQGMVINLRNVISMQLDVRRNNISYLNLPSEPGYLVYNVDLWACYQANGCGNTFTGYGDNNW